MNTVKIFQLLPSSPLKPQGDMCGHHNKKKEILVLSSL